jgi:hypothetical protein
MSMFRGGRLRVSSVVMPMQGMEVIVSFWLKAHQCCGQGPTGMRGLRTVLHAAGVRHGYALPGEVRQRQKCTLCGRHFWPVCSP